MMLRSSGHSRPARELAEVSCRTLPNLEIQPARRPSAMDARTAGLLLEGLMPSPTRVRSLPSTERSREQARSPGKRTGADGERAGRKRLLRSQSDMHQEVWLLGQPSLSKYLEFMRDMSGLGAE